MDITTISAFLALLNSEAQPCGRSASPLAHVGHQNASLPTATQKLKFGSHTIIHLGYGGGERLTLHDKI